jgi:hypothetical protein
MVAGEGYRIEIRIGVDTAFPLYYPSKIGESRQIALVLAGYLAGLAADASLNIYIKTKLFAHFSSLLIRLSQSAP